MLWIIWCLFYPFYIMYHVDCEICWINNKKGLQRLKTDTDRREALKSQLRFRKKFLKLKHRDPKLYYLSRNGPDGKYLAIHMDELKQNVITLIHDSLQVPIAERHEEGIHLLVGINVTHRFSDGIKYKACVVSVVPGFSDWFNNKYDGDIPVYAYNICKDYKKRWFRVVI